MGTTGSRRWLIALLVAATFTAAGCGGPQSPPDEAPQSKPGSAPASSPTSSTAGLEVELLGTPEAALTGAAALTAVDMQVDIRFLSDDAREGRGIGTKGLELSGEYIARRFEAAGLAPAGDDESFYQSFEIVVGGKYKRKAQALVVGDKALKLDKAWRPFAFTDNGELEAEVVFVGYGISAPDLGYDDYKGVDVKGKIVLAMRHEPGRRDKDSAFDGERASRHSDLRYKAHVARRHGAAGLLVINDPASYSTPTKGDPDALYAFKGAAGSGLLAAHMTWKGGGAALNKALGLDLAAVQKAIDDTGKPASRATGKNVRLALLIAREKATVRNVVGVLTPEGDADALLARHGALVVGAHYDHLGHGGASSMRPGSDDIHNGADDNASGTSMIMELAQALATRRADLKRRVYFVAFTAEEIGLRGSQYFVEHPPVPTDKIAAMLNFDMVGRLRDGRLTVGGVGTARELPGLVEATAKDLDLKIQTRRDGYGPSDQSPFYANRVPVLFFFTGAHDAYHTPDDDLDTLNFDGLETIGAYTYRILHYLALSKDRPLYTQADVRAEGDGGGTGHRSYGKASLGTVPSFDDTGGKGVKLQGVRKGSPAEKAGIKPGDLLVGLGGTEIKDLYDFTYALRDRKPGDKVKVAVMRGGQRIEVDAVLGTRK